jgi:hypothetical protein
MQVTNTSFKTNFISQITLQLPKVTNIIKQSFKDLWTNWFTRSCLPKYLIQTSTNQISNSAINLSLFCIFILAFNVNQVVIICCPTKFQHGISSVSFSVGQ